VKNSTDKIDKGFGLLLLVISTFILSPPAKNVFGVTDLPEFYCGAKMLFAGQIADIYDTNKFFALQKLTFPALGERGIPLYVAPYGLPFLSPYLLFPPDFAYLGIKILFLLLFGISLLIVCRWLNLSSKFQMRTFAVLPFFGPVWEALRIEQISALLFASQALFLKAIGSEKPVMAAVALSPFLMKPHLAAPVLFFSFGARKFRFCFAFLALAALLFLLSLLLGGTASYKSYSDLLTYSMVNLQWMSPEGTPTLRGQLLRLPFLEQTLATKIGAGVFVLFLFALIFVGRKLKEHYVSGIILLALPLGAVLSMHCYSYDLILLLPGIFFAISRMATKPIVKARLARDFVFLCLPLLAFTLPFYALIHYCLTLAGSVINYHFFILLILAIYLAKIAFQVSSETEKI
jgi:hypothetical protein